MTDSLADKQLTAVSFDETSIEDRKSYVKILDKFGCSQSELLSILMSTSSYDKSRWCSRCNNNIPLREYSSHKTLFSCRDSRDEQVVSYDDRFVSSYRTEQRKCINDAQFIGTVTKTIDDLDNGQLHIDIPFRIEPSGISLVKYLRLGNDHDIENISVSIVRDGKYQLLSSFSLEDIVELCTILDFTSECEIQFDTDIILPISIFNVIGFPIPNNGESVDQLIVTITAKPDADMSLFRLKYSVYYLEFINHSIGSHRIIDSIPFYKITDNLMYSVNRERINNYRRVPDSLKRSIIYDYMATDQSGDPLRLYAIFIKTDEDVNIKLVINSRRSLYLCSIGKLDGYQVYSLIPLHNIDTDIESYQHTLDCRTMDTFSISFSF